MASTVLDSMRYESRVLPRVTLGIWFSAVYYWVKCSIKVVFTKMFLFCEATEYADNIMLMWRDIKPRFMKLRFFGISALPGPWFGIVWECGLYWLSLFRQDLLFTFLCYTGFCSNSSFNKCLWALRARHYSILGGCSSEQNKVLRETWWELLWKERG